jgi:uncharacterized membrane protein
VEVETLEPVHAAVVPVGRRLLIGLLWGVTQIVIVFVLWYVCVVAAAYLVSGHNRQPDGRASRHARRRGGRRVRRP